MSKEKTEAFYVKTLDVALAMDTENRESAVVVQIRKVAAMDESEQNMAFTLPEVRRLVFALLRALQEAGDMRAIWLPLLWSICSARAAATSN